MKSSYHTETRNHKNHKIGSVRFIFGMVFRFGFKMHRVSRRGRSHLSPHPKEVAEEDAHPRLRAKSGSSCHGQTAPKEEKEDNDGSDNSVEEQI